MKKYELIENETTFLEVGTVLTELPDSEKGAIEIMITAASDRNPVFCVTEEGLRQLIPASHLREIKEEN